MTNQPIRIGYQGIKGSNSETATNQIVQQLGLGTVELIPLVSSKAVVQALREDTVDFGVMAVRNSIAGDVKETKDVLQLFLYNIADTVTVPINHCLFKHPDVSVSETTTIASHPQALLQTSDVRKQLFPTLDEQETADTALAAQQLADGTLSKSTMVLCSKQAGTQHGLDLVCEHVADSMVDSETGVSTNETEFVMVYLNKDKEKLLQSHHLGYSPISDERIDDAVRRYSKDNPTKMTIKWSSIEYRIPEASKVDLELAYRRTLRRYTVADEHQYFGATTFLIPKEVAATLHEIEPHTIARVAHLSRMLQGGQTTPENVQVAKRDALFGKFKRLFGR